MGQRLAPFLGDDALMRQIFGSWEKPFPYSKNKPYAEGPISIQWLSEQSATLFLLSLRTNKNLQ